MAVTYYKGFIGVEDVEFGVGVFNRIDSTGAAKQLNQINKSIIPRKTVIKIAAFTINANTYTGEATFTNAAAIAAMEYELPVAKAGLGPYHFTVIATQTITVDPNGTDLFRDCSAGKNKSSNVAGNRLSIWCDVNGTWEWDYELVSGNWTNEA